MPIQHLTVLPFSAFILIGTDLKLKSFAFFGLSFITYTGTVCPSLLISRPVSVNLTLYDKHYSLNVTPRSCTLNLKFGTDESKPVDIPEADTSGEDVFQICDPNTNPQLLASFKLIGIFVSIVKIIVPVILIIMGSIDMTKAVISNEGDAILKSAILFGKRALASVLVFMAPSVILGIFHMVDGMDNFDSKYKTCLNCILGDSSCPNVKFGG